MVTFADIKRVLDSLPYYELDVEEDKRLVEDYGLEDDDVAEALSFVQMELGISFCEDDAFFRFAGHLPLKELVEAANTDWDEMF